LLVTGRDEIGGLASLTELLARHNVNLAPSGGYYLLTPDTFVWTTFADFSHSKSSKEKVVGGLRGLDFVSKVDAIEMKGPALDQFLFPVMIGENHRGIIMDLSALMKVEQGLTKLLGSAGAALMFEEGKTFGESTLEHNLARIPEMEPAQLLDVVGGWLKATGWGIFKFDTTKFYDEGMVSVTIGEPPNSLNEGTQVSRFLNGVVVAIVEFVFNLKARVMVSRYDGPLRSLHLTLRVPR